MNFRNIDLHLLYCLQVLVSEKSVTRAAARLDMSQPAMSNVLARLREIFNDPILVRTGHGMSPTQRASDALPLIRNAMQSLSIVLRDDGEADLSEIRTDVTIAATDYTSSIFLPSLMNRISIEAPRMSVTIVPPDRSRFKEWLEDGMIDLTVGYFGELPEGLRARKVWNETMCCIASVEHSTIRGTLSMDQFVAADHAYWGIDASFKMAIEVEVDHVLSTLGYKRRIAMRTFSANLVARTVSSSDLIAIFSKVGAGEFAAGLKLQLLDLPFPLPTGAISMVWHDRTHRDPGLRWVRSVIAQSCAHR